jgi:glycosyltransferase involved in cell wall biosynthesis
MVSDVIRHTEPTILITSTIENFGGAAWRAASIGGVVCAHILRSYYTICWRGTLMKNGKNCTKCCIECRLSSLGRRVASHLVDGLIGVSQNILQRHLDEGLFTRALPIVLPEPIPCAFYRRPRITQNGMPIFGFLGVLSPVKGVEVLAAAWTRLQPKRAKLIIAGTGDPSYVQRLKTLMPSDVEFRGWVVAEQFLPELDYLIVPSIWQEPFGRIIVEAFACGVPVLGSRTGGIQELINADITGFLFENGSVYELEKTIRQAIELTGSDYGFMSENCLRKAQYYKCESVSTTYLQYFYRLLERRRYKPILAS